MTAAQSSEAPILVPVDFSSHSEDALVWAAEVASAQGAPMVVLHVVHDPAEAPGYYLEAQAGGDHDPAPPLRSLEEAARIMMERFVETVAERHPVLKDVEVRLELVVGVPTSRILEVAEALGARLIVMGSQGRTGLPRALLGSKAESVVRLARIPVTIVKRSQDAGDE